MSLTVAELNTKLTADISNLQKGLGKAEQDVASFSSTGASAMKAFGGAIAAVAASDAFQKVTEFLTEAIKGASDLAEAANAAGVAFGQSTPEVTAWAESLSAAFGATRTEALTAASQFQLVAQAAGFTGTQITDLAERAFDLGSVFNASAQEVSTAIKAGLVGEFEPLRRFGVILNQNQIQAEALAQGLIKPKEEMSAGVKQAVIYSEIMKQTAFAQGDAENTADAAAGQMRQLKVEMDDLKNSVGAALLPAFKTFVDLLNSSVIPAFYDLLNAGGKVAGVFFDVGEGLSKGIGAVLDKIGLDSFAETAKGIAGDLDDWSEASKGAGTHFQDLAKSLIDTNAAGGAARSINRDVSDSLDDVKKSADGAQKALVKFKDAQFAVGDAAFALKDAQFAAVDAQKELDDLIKSGGVDLEKLAGAQQDATRAQDDLTDANKRATDAQDDYNKALADATEKHLRDVQDATDDLMTAQEKLADQTQDVADAEAKLAKLKAQKQARDDAIKNAEAQLDAADTVTERIIAQNALSKALGMEVVTDAELASAQSGVTTEQGKLTNATDGVTKAQKDLQTIQQQLPAQFDSVKNAADRLKGAQDAVVTATNGVTTAQNALNVAQQVSPTYASDLERAQIAVSKAGYQVEQATWAQWKAQWNLNDAVSAYKDDLNSIPRQINTTISANVVFNGSNFAPGTPTNAFPGFGSVGRMHDGGIVPGPRGQEVAAILEAGERVVPANDVGGLSGGSGQPMIIQLVADGKVLQEILLGHQRRSGALGFN